MESLIGTVCWPLRTRTTPPVHAAEAFRYQGWLQTMSGKLSVKEAAKRIGIHPSTAGELIRKGRLRATEVPHPIFPGRRAYELTVSDVDAYKRQRSSSETNTSSDLLAGLVALLERQIEVELEMIRIVREVMAERPRSHH